MDGSFSLGDNPQIDAIKVHAENVDIAQVEKLALRTAASPARSNADATIAGSAKAPSVDGAHRGPRRSVPAVQIRVAGRRRDVCERAHRHRRAARAGARRRADGQGHAAAERAAIEPRAGRAATCRRPRPTAIDLRIQSPRIDLGLIQGFTNQVTNVTGTLQADITSPVRAAIRISMATSTSRTAPSARAGGRQLHAA